MKVLFNCDIPFMLAHGGLQVQIEQTKAALEKIGVAVEPLRWWDENQTGEIIHHFSRIPATLLHSAQQKGFKVVFSDLLGGTGARSSGQLWLQRTLTRALQSALPPSRITTHWESFRQADACLALTPWEAHLMSYIFGAPPEKVHVVPNGVEAVFLNSPRAAERGPWLVCTATITEVKRVMDLARAAVQARTPLWFIGKAYADSQAYAQQFFALARQHPDVLRYEGPIQERDKLARVYREARGFVLLSAWESLSLSALEAAACECPLLLSDLPWARHSSGQTASYCPLTTSVAKNARGLRRFYDQAPALPVPAKPKTWSEIAEQLKTLYRVSPLRPAPGRTNICGRSPVIQARPVSTRPVFRPPLPWMKIARPAKSGPPRRDRARRRTVSRTSPARP